MTVDPAILRTVGLDAQNTKQTFSGGSGFASSYRVTGSRDGQQVNYFIKTGRGQVAEAMFRGEHASLNAIHNAVPDFCPASHGHGLLANSPGTFFLATDFLDLQASGPAGSGLTLAAKLAKLHTTRAPVPPGWEKPVFGFEVPTCCGSTEQNNSWRESWVDFFADNRLRTVARAAVAKHGKDAAFEKIVEEIAVKVVPRLLGAVRDIKPVVIHGDLWSGNHGQAVIAGQGGVEAVVYDPSAVYGHSEYELGIMRMFGGFGKDFWDEYEQLVPKAEPEEEWEDRVTLYQVYHHLNHYLIFGGGYKGSAMALMEDLISEHG